MATVRRVPDEHGEAEAIQPATPARVAPRARRQPRYGQPFFPVVPFGSSLYILATVIALVTLSIVSKAPLQNPADPLNHEKINPRPEWYFLFLFQILKIFQGPFEIIGTAIIPAVIGLVLIGLPFYDRNWSRRAVRRPIATTLAGIAVLGLAYLTYLPIASTAALQTAGASYPATVLAQPTWANVHAIFAQNCQPCHIGASTGGLNLDTYQGAMKGGSTAAGGVVNGAVVKPGNPAGSFLYLAVIGKQKLGLRMPANGKILPSTDVQNIYNWIKNGAKGP